MCVAGELHPFIHPCSLRKNCSCLDRLSLENVLRATAELPSHGGKSEGTGRLMGGAITSGMNVLLGRGSVGEGEVKEERGIGRKMETLNVLWYQRRNGEKKRSK